MQNARNSEDSRDPQAAESANPYAVLRGVADGESRIPTRSTRWRIVGLTGPRLGDHLMLEPADEDALAFSRKLVAIPLEAPLPTVELRVVEPAVTTPDDEPLVDVGELRRERDLLRDELAGRERTIVEQQNRIEQLERGLGKADDVEGYPS